MSRSIPTRFRTGAVFAVLALLVASCTTPNDERGGEPTSTTGATTPTVPAEFSGYVRTPLVDVSSVTLPTVDDAPVEMVAEPDGLLLVFFGYATCPDVCPMTLTLLKSAVAQQDAADRERVQVAMITIDPTRDTPEVFGAYLAQYFPDGLALRSDEPADLRAAADAFGANYEIRMTREGKREVSHSDDLYVVDDTGKIVLTWSYGLSPEAVTSDLGRLLAGDRPDPET